MRLSAKSSPSTPTRKRSPPVSEPLTPSLVTPSADDENDSHDRKGNKSSKARRQLSMPAVQERDECEDDDAGSSTSPARKSFFGRNASNDSAAYTVQSNTRQVYALVNKMTGSIGGNGEYTARFKTICSPCIGSIFSNIHQSVLFLNIHSGHGGAIYGELTVGSMQKMVELMKIHTKLGPESRFIDVGSGLGKPNLHVAQDPAVEFSYGIEMEHVRWMLGMSNLKTVLQGACEQQEEELQETEKMRHQCNFSHGDITEANYFDPFTHVYMFDIGFPPKLFKQLGQMFNKSQSDYLICYHGPKLMIERYGFNVELIVQAPTSMHGSSEGHMGYIYKRAGKKQKIGKGLPSVYGVPCDPLFADAWKSTKRDVEVIFEDVKKQVSDSLNSQRPKRKRSTRSRYV
jgi:hypothetical protein